MCWQNPFNQLEYSIIGDDAAPTYFAINSGGMITLRQSIPSINTDVYNVSAVLYLLPFCNRHWDYPHIRDTA